MLDSEQLSQLVTVPQKSKERAKFAQELIMIRSPKRSGLQSLDEGLCEDEWVVIIYSLAPVINAIHPAFFNPAL